MSKCVGMLMLNQYRNGACIVLGAVIKKSEGICYSSTVVKKYFYCLASFQVQYCTSLRMPLFVLILEAYVSLVKSDEYLYPMLQLSN